MIRIYYNTIRHNTLYKSNKFDIKFFKPNLKKLKYAFISYFQPLCEIFIFYASNKVRFFYPNVLNSRVDYTSEYVFRLFKEAKMDGEYIKTDEIELTADEFADALK